MPPPIRSDNCQHENEESASSYHVIVRPSGRGNLLVCGLMTNPVSGDRHVALLLAMTWLSGTGASTVTGAVIQRGRRGHDVSLTKGRQSSGIPRRGGAVRRPSVAFRKRTLGPPDGRPLPGVSFNVHLLLRLSLKNRASHLRRCRWIW